MSYAITDKNLLDIVSALKKISKTEALALGGSRSQGNQDKMSDYDLYVYCSEDIGFDDRNGALSPFCKEAEICNQYWESEDNCVMNNGICVDIIYRRIDFFEQFADKMLEGRAMNGYTTAFWHNIVTSKIIFDKSGRFTDFQSRLNVTYPENLRTAIITQNRNLLSGKLPSYDKQIKKAAQRGDIVSVHHRITEYLASYFDIIFAVNRLTHPGEKRLVQLCKSTCAKLPENFEENINALLGSVLNGNSYEIVCRMNAELDKIIDIDVK